MSVVSLRYAHAFVGVAESMHLDAMVAQQQMRDFAGTLRDSSELREVLRNPSIPSQQKLRVLDAIAGRIGMYPQVRNLIAVIMDHQRLADFDQIVAEYMAIANADSELTEAEITSARNLGDAERAELEAQVAKLAGGKVHATYHEDSTLLGGAVVRIGSTVYDGSIRTQLNRPKQELVAAQG